MAQVGDVADVKSTTEVPATVNPSGFKEFLLRGNVVDLAVAVVVGAAFKELINAFVAAFITPLIGMIKPGSTGDLSFYIRGSRFQYGLFIDALISFIIICTIVYFCVVKPLIALLTRVYPNMVILRTCPECLSDDIPAYCNRCKHCCSSLTPVVKTQSESMLSKFRSKSGTTTAPPATGVTTTAAAAGVGAF